MAFASGTYDGVGKGKSGLVYALTLRLDLNRETQLGKIGVSGDLYRDAIDPVGLVGSFVSTSVEPGTEGEQLTAQVLFYDPNLSSENQLHGSLSCSPAHQNSSGTVLACHLTVLNGVNTLMEELYLSLTLDMPNAFRQIEYEVDQLDGTQRWSSYTFAERIVSVPECLQRAGILLNPGGTWKTITGDEIAGHAFTVDELHAIMDAHFTLLSDKQAWKLYVLIATRYQDPQVTGAMFDLNRRRGTAVFYDTLNDLYGADPEVLQRNYIRTAVHEIAHTLNLVHTFDPTNTGGLGSAGLPSFMNYPQLYTKGEAAYWQDFKFEFAQVELQKMCHGPLQHVIMGGEAYQGDAADRVWSRLGAGRSVNGVALKLRIKQIDSPKMNNQGTAVLEFGQPVRVELKVHNLSGEERLVTRSLSPSHHQTAYMVRKPNGSVSTFRPLVEYTSVPRVEVLHPDRPALWDEVDLTYGLDGFTFAEPGNYHIQAVSQSRDGLVHSNMLALWIRYPERSIENLIIPAFDDEVGKYLAFGGTDTRHHLPKAKATLDALVDNIGKRGFPKDHPLADAYQASESLVSARGFRDLDREASRLVETVPPQPNIEAFHKALGLNKDLKIDDLPSLSNLLFGQLAGILTRALVKDGKKEESKRVLDEVVRHLKKHEMPEWAVKEYKKQWAGDEVDAVTA
jgi:hypothetical protein